VGQIDEIADRYVSEWAALDPIGATSLGVAGHDDRLTDLSPEGHAALAELDEMTLAQLRTVVPADEAERVSQEAMLERLQVAIDMYDSGATTSELSVLTGGLHAVRDVFDLMATDSAQAVETLTTRLSAVPTAYAQSRRTLLEAAEHGHVASRNQILEVAKQCDIWVAADGDDFWPGLAHRAAEGVDLPDSLQADLARRGSLRAFVATERFYEIGSPSGLKEAEEFVLRRAG